MKQRSVRSAVVVFVVALLLRLLHIWQLRHSPFLEVLMGDAQGYHEWARRIAGGEWIGTEVFYQAPLYPYFLGAIYTVIGESPIAVRVIQALLGAASCALIALAGRRFFSPRVGLVAGLALAVYAPAIFFDTLIQKSVLDTFFIALALWLLSLLAGEHPVGAPPRTGVWLALGASMGALSLTRENALVFIGVILIWCLRPRASNGQLSRAVSSRSAEKQASPASGPDKVHPTPHDKPGRRRTSSPLPKQAPSVRWSTAAAFVLGLALVLMPVAIRNYAVGGGFFITTSQFGPNFYIGNNPRSDGTYMSLRFGRGAPEYERVDATELAEHALGRTLTPAEVSAYWTDQALDFITGDPGAWLKLMGRKFLLLWNASEMLDTESQESYAEWSWPLRIGGWFGHFGVLVPLALLGAVLAWPERRRLAVLYGLTLAYAASILLFYVFARYRLPLVPFLMLFAGVALVSASEWVRAVYEHRRARRARRGNLESNRLAPSDPLPIWQFSARSAISAVIVISGTIVFTNWPVLSKPLMRAITENNLATALNAAGKGDEAIAHYRRAIAIQPDYAPAYNNLGVVLRAQGQVDEAIATYHQALRVNDDYPDAHYNLANALLQENRAGEAEEHFRIALRSIPDSAGVRNNLGIALAAGGRPDDAIAAFRAAVGAEPSSARAHRNLGDSLTNAGHLQEGLQELQRALELDPNDPATHYNLGSVLLEAGRFDEAITRFRATLQLSPRSVEAHNNLGIALGSKGQIDAAIAEFQQALQIDPGFADAQRNLAMATQAREQARGRR
jgi:tetratricopeptide (TPR) repeat protein